MPKIAFYTLGCKSNQYETDLMKFAANQLGLEIVDFHSPADIYVINTCTVTHVADKKGRQAIRSARRRNPNSIIIVTGCLAEIHPEEIAKMSEADVILPNREKKDISKYLKNIIQKAETIKEVSPLPCRVRMNLMIEDGCEHFCTYCIVPYARGPVKSKPIEEILSEVKKFVSLGAREIVLTGINLGAYGIDKESESTLPKVIREVVKIDGLLRLRLSSLEPMFIKKELVDTISETEKVCPHLHIPLQSGDNNILKKMGRNYTLDDFINLIEYIREKIKDVAINTDIIVGFPGEGEKEFLNTVEAINKIKFSRIHIFPFSLRKKTPAENFDEKVPEREIKRRCELLNNLRTKYMREFAEKYLGKDVKVLVECKDKRTGLLEGLTPQYIRVLFKGKDDRIGNLQDIKIKEIKDEYCLA